MSAFAAEAPRVLHISLQTVGVKPVARVKRINHAQILPCMRNVIPARIAHFILLAVLLYSLNFICKAGLHVMFPRLMRHRQLHALYRSLKIIARMLHIGAHTKILACLRLGKPVLPLYVILFLLVGMKRRRRKCQPCILAETARNAQRAEIRSEQVFFASVEIHLERLYILHCAETRLTILRIKIIMALGNVAHQLYFPSAVGFIRQVRLIVKKVRTIFSLGLKSAQQYLFVLYLSPLLHENFLVLKPT